MTAKITKLTAKKEEKPTYFAKKFSLSDEVDNKKYCAIMNKSGETVEIVDKRETITEMGDLIVWLQYWEYPKEIIEDVQDTDLR